MYDKRAIPRQTKKWNYITHNPIWYNKHGVKGQLKKVGTVFIEGLCTKRYVPVDL